MTTSAARRCSCDGPQAAKKLLHIQGRLERVDAIIRRGKDAYLAGDLLQEAGDSLMMKLGEAANRLSRLGVLAPDGVEWALAVANPQLHHPPVQRDQPRPDLAHAPARSPYLARIVGTAIRGSRVDGPRTARLRTTSRQQATAFETPPHPVALRIALWSSDLVAPSLVPHADVRRLRNVTRS
jgi:hypothetical protein